MLRTLIARWKAVRALVKGEMPPRVADVLDGLLARIRTLEAAVEELEQTNALATEREVRWVEMNAQLRRYLGRLDAHAGIEKRKEEESNHGGARSDVLAAKYPKGLPTRE